MKIMFLSRNDIEKVLDMKSTIDGVREVYRRKSLGMTAVWPLISYDFENPRGVMDIKSGCVFGENVHGLKMLNSFPGNAQRGLPIFTGMLMIFDSETGIPQGVMDASYITCMRTGAAGALGASLLARPESHRLFILGAGRQAMFQIAASLLLMPKIDAVRISDPLDAENARRFAAGCRERLPHDFGIDASAVAFEAAEDTASALAESDIAITVTPARSPVIKKEWVKPGLHLSCVGADMPGKEEIEPEIFTGARIFTDDTPQCLRCGELELAAAKGAVSEKDIAGELGDVIAGKTAGRTSPEEITIFDATGIAMLDLVTGKKALELAKEKGLGQYVEL